MVDIRIPIGFMFLLIGLIITILGLFTLSDSEMYQKSLGVNVNIIMGAIMLIFGIVMLYLAYRKKEK
jgi:multisubunit Na+/H+ antiporter MnhG subunit